MLETKEIPMSKNTTLNTEVLIVCEHKEDKEEEEVEEEED